MDRNLKINKLYDIPLMIMMCGLPGSGKSTFADGITIQSDKQEYKPIIHSSDSLRKELYGDESTQGDNNKLFTELHRRIKADLSNGKDVIYDATSLKKKNRIQFLQELKNIPCTPICILMATEYEACLCNNEHRERKVPIEVIKRMQMNFEPPAMNEGFSNIAYVFSYLDENHNIVDTCSSDKYKLDTFFKKANSFNQENKHHRLTLGEHCAQTGSYIQNEKPDNFWLMIAALLHDNGKLYTKTRVNSKGVDDGNCHYFQHHCVGSYIAMFYVLEIFEIMKTDKSIECVENPIEYVTNLIFYHMHPYMQWKQSARVYKRDREMLGEEMYNDIMLLHEADVAAH